MRIELVQQNEGLSGRAEVWVRVLSNEVQDWPDVRDKLSEDQAAVLRTVEKVFSTGEPKVSAFYPHMVTPKERAEHGYSMEDWFVFKVRGSVAK